MTEKPAVGTDGSTVETDEPATGPGGPATEVDEPAVEVVGTRETGRWRGVSAIAFLAGGVGVLAGGGRPALLLAAVVGVAYGAFARAASQPSVSLDVERTLSDANPDPEDEVTVTVTVRNAGDGLLPDLRLVDGVPDALSVADGSPRHGTALRPGATATFSYAVTARRGELSFDPLVAVARDASGAVEREVRVPAETTLTCRPPLGEVERVPLRQQTTRYTGRVTTDVGGEGVEFYATREYRPGDPMNRVDWNRRARTGDLSTLQFREERAATVVLLVDARESAYRAPDEDAPHAVDRSVAAAGASFSGLLDSGDRVGIASLGPETCWLAPGAGQAHAARARELLATHPGLSPTPPEQVFFPTIKFRTLQRRFPADAQVLLFSPLCDDFVAEAARRLDARGHLVTVVSPDVTAADTAGRRLAAVERDVRLTTLRETGIRAVNWRTDEPLAAAFSRAETRWSR